ncbi:MAG: Crp/Fnr family transcriptional regulator [Rhodospirillaceae bacterium]
MSVPRGTNSRHTSSPEIGNRLIDGLPPSERAAFGKHIEAVELQLEEQLMEPRAPVKRVFFPTTAVCSIIIGLASGQRAEMGTIGNEGFVGIPVVLRARASEFAVVQIPGSAYAMSAATLASLMGEHEALHRALLRYVGYAYHMAKQTTACNAYHSVGQRLARWLLTAHDRARRDEFPLTQELLSHMVAATRPRISEAAAVLRAEGIIDYHHGIMHIRDRSGLESKSCECYAATRYVA